MARFLGTQHAAGSGAIEGSSTHDHGSVRSGNNRHGGAAGAAGAYDPLKDNQHGYNANMAVGMLAPPGMETGTASVSKKSGFMKMFGKGNSSQAAQRLPGAEASIPTTRKNASTIDDQMDFFSQQTGKLLIFRRQKREVLFATPELGESE